MGLSFIEILSFLTTVLIGLITNIFGLRKRYEKNTRIDGKVVVITGANTGIGKETALQLSKRGAKIIIGCRDLKKGEKAVNDMKAINPKTNIVLLELDLSSLKSVRHFVQTISRTESKVDILINNAGVITPTESSTEDGFEMQFQTNYLGHFLLTLSLIKLLKKSSNSRIINVSSKGHLKGKIDLDNINLRKGAYNPYKALCQSKLANILFTRQLSRRLGPMNNIKAYCLHPGVINTDMARDIKIHWLLKFMMSYAMISVELGAQTTLYCALEPSLEHESGYYYDNCQKVDKMVEKARDDKTGERLWEMSCDFVKLDEKLRLD